MKRLFSFLFVMLLSFFFLEAREFRGIFNVEFGDEFEMVERKMNERGWSVSMELIPDGRFYPERRTVYYSKSCGTYGGYDVEYIEFEFHRIGGIYTCMADDEKNCWIVYYCDGMSGKQHLELKDMDACMKELEEESRYLNDSENDL